jgi:predicted nicotinamide N-methyase
MMSVTMDPSTFIRAHTKLLPVALVPEIRLYLADAALPLWQKTEEELASAHVPPPYWAFAWAGGQALARHVLDNAPTVAAQRVLDIGAGGGLVAIAALKAGAVHALAADIDALALAAIGLNGAANAVGVATTPADVLAAPPPESGVVLVGDLFYERSLAARVLKFLESARAQGLDVLVGDPGRSYFPKDRFRQVAEYAVPVSRELEDVAIKATAVWRLAP